MFARIASRESRITARSTSDKGCIRAVSAKNASFRSGSWSRMSRARRSFALGTYEPVRASSAGGAAGAIGSSRCSSRNHSGGSPKNAEMFARTSSVTLPVPCPIEYQYASLLPNFRAMSLKTLYADTPPAAASFVTFARTFRPITGRFSLRKRSRGVSSGLPDFRGAEGSAGADGSGRGAGACAASFRSARSSSTVVARYAAMAPRTEAVSSDLHSSTLRKYRSLRPVRAARSFQNFNWLLPVLPSRNRMFPVTTSRVLPALYSGAPRRPLRWSAGCVRAGRAGVSSGADRVVTTIPNSGREPP